MGKLEIHNPTHMGLFTFIMDYKGETYISQIQADGKTTAMIFWIQNLNTSKIKGFSKLDEKRVIDAV
jgi:hypothetical protein